MTTQTGAKEKSETYEEEHACSTANHRSDQHRRPRFRQRHDPNLPQIPPKPVYLLVRLSVRQFRSAAFECSKRS